MITYSIKQTRQQKEGEGWGGGGEGVDRIGERGLVNIGEIFIK